MALSFIVNRTYQALISARLHFLRASQGNVERESRRWNKDVGSGTSECTNGNLECSRTPTCNDDVLPMPQREKKARSSSATLDQCESGITCSKCKKKSTNRVDEQSFVCANVRRMWQEKTCCCVFNLTLNHNLNNKKSKIQD